MITTNVLGHKIIEVCQTGRQTPHGKVYDLEYIQLDNGVRIVARAIDGRIRTEAVQQARAEAAPMSWKHRPDEIPEEETTP